MQVVVAWRMGANGEVGARWEGVEDGDEDEMGRRGAGRGSISSEWIEVNA